MLLKLGRRPSAQDLRGVLVALDIDGTLVSQGGVVSPRVEAAVHAIVRFGASVVFATGRSSIAAYALMKQFELQGAGNFAVCSNGSSVIMSDTSSSDGFDVVHTRTFDPEPAVKALSAELPDALVAVEDTHGGFKVSGLFPAGELVGPVQVTDYEELVCDPAIRVAFHDPEKGPDDFHVPAARANLVDLSYAVGYTAWLDVVPAGVSKASGLDWVVRALDMPRCTTVAVGDQRNDLAMLEWADFGVAMGQAPDEVHRVADASTGSVEDDGLAVVLEALVEDFR